MFHVKALPEPPLGGLDLNIADEEEFSSDKLRTNIERSVEVHKRLIDACLPALTEAATEASAECD